MKPVTWLLTLCSGTLSEFKEQISQLPKDCTSISLGGTDFGAKSPSEFAAYMSEIPEHVTDVQLFNNNLGSLSTEALLKGLTALHNKVKRLSLAGNKLNLKKADELVQMLHVFNNKSLDSLDMSANDLGQLGITISRVYQAVPTTVNDLNLRNNQLNFRIGSNLRTVPKTVKTLDIGDNVLTDDSDLEVPEGIEKLILRDIFSKNENQPLSAKAFIAILKKLPKSLYSLTWMFWENNIISQWSREDRCAVFAAMPPSVTQFKFYQPVYNATVFTDFFHSMSPNITDLDLSNNSIFVNRDSIENLLRLFFILSLMSKNVTHLNLSGNGILERGRKDASLLEKIKLGLGYLPTGITHLRLDSIENLYINDVFQLFEASVLPKNIQYLAFGDDEFRPLSEVRKEVTQRFAAEAEQVRQLDAVIMLIDKKTDDLVVRAQTDEDCLLASQVALQLRESIHKSRNLYYDSTKNPTNFEQFQNNCMTAIAQARPVLETHRGWAKALARLASILVSIASLGVANLITGKSGLGLFAPKTDSAKVLDELEDKLNQNKGAAKP